MPVRNSGVTRELNSPPKSRSLKPVRGETSSGLDIIEIPIFPLPNVVLFPNTLLPLHIFEQRYRQMVTEVLDESGKIGMALLKQPWEVGGEDIFRIGGMVRLPSTRSSKMVSMTFCSREPALQID